MRYHLRHARQPRVTVFRHVPRPGRIRAFIRVCLLPAVLCCPAANRGTAAEAPRPNIILVMPDDQGYPDLGRHGNPVLKTPQIDRFAEDSRRFTDFHVSPTCAPTRSAIMTGRHEFRNGVTHTIMERERLTLSATTLPQVLKAAGYTTGIFGKWHLGDEDEYQPGKRGFDEVYIHGAGGIGQSYPGSCGDAPGNSYFGPVIRHNGVFTKTSGYCTDEFFRQATAWIESVHGKQPFFCYITPNAPHSPLDCPPEYFARYKGQVPENVAKFYGMITNIDDNFGRLLQMLKARDLERDTIVIFMTDNGSATGHRFYSAGLRAAKGSPYQGGTKVPSFWRWPGHWTPGDCDALTCHQDILPTLMDLLQISPNAPLKEQIEGRSLVPLLVNPRAAWPDRYLFTHVGRWDVAIDPRQTPEIPKFSKCSVRWRDWTLVSMAPRGPAQWELFDLSNDPGQQTDVAAAHPEVVARLVQAYEDWWTSILPGLVNEGVAGPAQNPFHVAYWQQYQGPGPNNVPPVNAPPVSASQPRIKQNRATVKESGK